MKNAQYHLFNNGEEDALIRLINTPYHGAGVVKQQKADNWIREELKKVSFTEFHEKIAMHLTVNGRINIKRIFKSAEDVRIIIKLVCKIYSVSIEDIRSDSRKVDIVGVRHALIYWLNKYTSLDFKQIGKLVCRDRSTIYNSLEAYEAFRLNYSYISSRHNVFIKNIEEYV